MAPTQAVMATDQQAALEFQLLTLSGADEGESYVIRMFGRDSAGSSVCLATTFTPYFYVLLEQGQTKESVHAAIKKRMVTINPDYDSDDEDSSQKKWLPLRHHMKNPIVVSRKKYWGFENGKKYSFVQLTFTTEKAWRRAKRVADKEEFKIYEGDISPVLRFVHIQKLQTTGWIRANNATNVSSKQTDCHVEMRCPWKEVQFADNSSMAPFVQASFDVECYSFDRSFPDPAKPQNCVYQIATTFQRFGETEPYHKHLVCLGTCDDIEGVAVECVEKEADVYSTWSRAVREQHSDIVVGYNIWGFDMKYMWARAGLLGCKKTLNFSKIKAHQTDLRTSKSSSAAYGDNEYHILTSPGVYQIDLYAWMKKEVKMESGIYSLDHVADHYLGQKKNDVTPQQIFEMFTQGPTERKIVGEYCVQVRESVCATAAYARSILRMFRSRGLLGSSTGERTCRPQIHQDRIRAASSRGLSRPNILTIILSVPQDTVLPLRLMDKLKTLHRLTALANACYVPLDYLIVRGQSIKVGDLFS